MILFVIIFDLDISGGQFARFIYASRDIVE
jgi:hypothetical protein